MQVKKLIMLSVFGILLSGCSKSPSINPQNQVSPTELPKVTSTPYVYSAIDYSGHTNERESLYITKLADPSKLKEGSPVFSLQELTVEI